MDGIKWSEDFKEKKAVFSGIWDNSLDLLLECVEKDYLNSEALTLNQANALPVRERMLDGTLLLAYGNVRAADTIEQRDRTV